jgi:hypothetical protein
MECLQSTYSEFGGDMTIGLQIFSIINFSSLPLSVFSVMTLAEKAFTRGVTKFGNIHLLDDKEFGLLLAILCTHSSGNS